jgi:adenylate kinase
MNIIIFGPQGSGKGTQAAMLAKKLKLYHLSMGEELRKEIKRKTILGKRIEKIVNNGKLVPFEITNNIALKISKSKDARKGVILDGYPRSKKQWLFVKKNINIDVAIELHLSSKESIRRIASRRICPKCGINYNTIWLKPKKNGICDKDKAILVHREDDKPKAVIDRLKIYHSQTEPLKREYKKLGILQVIDGSKSIDSVNKKLLEKLKSYK